MARQSASSDSAADRGRRRFLLGAAGLAATPPLGGVASGAPDERTGRGNRVTAATAVAGTSTTRARRLRTDRVAENLDAFDFELTDEQMTHIAALDTGRSMFFDHRDPTMVSRLGTARVD
ncbi:hypothetical protein LFM09_03540 [Lentzea alba]|uniref:hypothetical protein n=1 Tax=Lentzea alba TaxID=2714351 RepID=UPI0039BFE0DD